MPEEQVDFVNEDKELQVAPEIAQVSEKTSQEEELSVKSQKDKVLSPREAIYAKADQRNHSTETIPPVEEEEILPETKESPEAAKPEDQPKAPESDKTPKPEQVEVKVLGRTKMVDKAKVDARGGIEAYQKIVAADEMLRQAAEERKAVVSERSTFDNEKAAFTADKKKYEETKTLSIPDKSATSSDLSIDDQNSEVSQDVIEKALLAALDGDVEEGAKALVNAINGVKVEVPQPETFDSEELLAKATNNAIQHIEQRQNVKNISEAKADFAIAFPEIMNDETLFHMADRKSAEIKAQHPNLSPGEILQQAGDEVTEWLGERGLGAAAKVSQSDKVAEKRAMRTPTAGSGRSQKKPEPKPQTRSEYIKQLQAQRGQG